MIDIASDDNLKGTRYENITLMNLEQLIDYAMEHDASDIHLITGHCPAVRIHGSIKRIKIDELTSDQIKDMVYPFMSEDQKKEYEEESDLDFAINIEGKGRYRVNLFLGIHGISAAMRVISGNIVSFEDLGAPAIIEEFTKLDRGLVLVTGATGSGKTTTLTSMIDLINKNHHKHIITIEDPIEFIHHSDKSLINQREIGVHTKSFHTALKSALREDPDVIFVGELRTLDDIRLALTAAETGHLVLSALHTNSAAKAIDRIIDVFPAGDKDMVRSMLAGTIEAVIAQKLLKTADGKGRIGAYEIMVATGAVRNLIRENKIPQIRSLIEASTANGMMTMDSSVESLAKKGVISMETASEMLKNEEVLEKINDIAMHNKLSHTSGGNESCDF